MEISNGNGKLKEPLEFFGDLNKIVEDTSGLHGIPIGILTAEHRDSWADIYER